MKRDSALRQIVFNKQNFYFCCSVFHVYILFILLLLLLIQWNFIFIEYFYILNVLSLVYSNNLMIIEIFNWVENLFFPYFKYKWNLFISACLNRKDILLLLLPTDPTDRFETVEYIRTNFTAMEMKIQKSLYLESICRYTNIKEYIIIILYRVV
jgi:hypothetical protein